MRTLSSQNILEARKICKQFPGVLALDQADLVVQKGEVLAIIGENGAGKSTLMKILSGAYRQDAGEITLDGEKLDLYMTPKDRIDAGISIIYQELNYLDSMTIADNLFMGRIPLTRRLKRVDYKKLGRDTAAILKTFYLTRSPFTEMGKLTVAEKQIVEILRAVSKDVKVLIMDEPTSSLNEVETRRLFELINELKTKGVSILYITHKLNEVFTIADRVQVMRDGRVVGILEVDKTDTRELVELMVGRTIDDMYPKEEAEIGDVVLKVEDLSCDIAREISFEVRQGELVGLFGLEGSGRVEAVEGILGLKKRECGQVYLKGKPVEINNPIDAKKHGVAYVPSDRKKDGLVLIHSVKNNLTVTYLKELAGLLALDAKKEKALVGEWIGRLKIKTPHSNTVVNSLSGGNQQKIVIAKWLLTNPGVLILNDPTKGIDVGAKVEVYKLMEQLCKNGIGIVMVSSELPEIVGIADKAVIFHKGRVKGEVRRSEFDQKKMLYMAVGGC